MSKNRQLLENLYQEFNNFLHDFQGVYLDSVAGYHLILKEIEKEEDFYQDLFPSNSELSNINFLDGLSFSHSSVTDREYAASAIHFTKKGNVKRRNSINGSNQLFLGNMAVVTVYTFWEKYFRNKLAKALGAESSGELQTPIWGDLRILRHGIIHNNNVVAKKYRKKIEIIHYWFQDTWDIKINEKKFRRIFLELLKFNNWIHSKSMPPRMALKLPSVKS